MIDINYEYDPDLIVKIAENKEELEGAFQVIYRSYLEMGYCTASESEMRLTLHHALPTTSVIIAKYKGKVVGTLSLVRNNNLKLPCEKEWNIDFLKANDRRVAEITSLAIDKEFRRVQKGNIFLPVLKYMYEFSTKCFGTEILAIVIHPREKAFYEGLFLFSPIDKKVVQDYYGAPAVALYLDLIATKPIYEKKYNHKRTSKNVYHFFVEFNSKNLIMPKKNLYSVDYPVLNKELFKYFFFEKSTVGHDVDSETLANILSHYPGRQDLRIATRFSVDIEASVFCTDLQKRNKIIIKNISESGIRVISLNSELGHMQSAKNYQIQFDYKGSTFEMLVENQWVKMDSQAGFKVKSNQLNWHRFLKAINHNYEDSSEIKNVFENQKRRLG